MSSYSNPPNFENLLLQTLMGRLQVRPPNPLQHQSSPSVNQTLESLLFDTINNLPDTDDEEDENNNSGKTQLAKEESKLEEEVIKIILSGNTEESLKPNSGEAVRIGEHHICIGYHVEPDSEYRVWEWHGHIMLFDEENGYNYNPEYIYGNYFEKLRVVPEKMKVKAEEDKVVNSGLKELIESSEDAGSGRILHRNINVGSTRV
ncbi:unnamed protein product [Lactuca saligna]|uniref:Uncharacterized protein n=1 Tax=Lactuca saligna TaxID=75948 RepID=A0AA35YG91_LACSI|nr:unnamed protein product [Lactuca saligna]